MLVDKIAHPQMAAASSATALRSLMNDWVVSLKQEYLRASSTVVIASAMGSADEDDEDDDDEDNAGVAGAGEASIEAVAKEPMTMFPGAVPEVAAIVSTLPVPLPLFLFFLSSMSR
jgi:hypothetical protein